MPTAQQITDVRRQLRQLEPTGVLATEFINNLVAMLEAGQEETVTKMIADQIFNNDATLADLVGLETGTLAINSTYVVELILRIESVSITPDAKIKFVVPVGATIEWVLGKQADLIVENTDVTVGVASTIAGIGIVTVTGILTIGGTAGTLKVQGAQNAATIEDTTYKVGSNLVVTKI